MGDLRGRQGQRGRGALSVRVSSHCEAARKVGPPCSRGRGAARRRCQPRCGADAEGRGQAAGCRAGSSAPRRCCRRRAAPRRSPWLPLPARAPPAPGCAPGQSWPASRSAGSPPAGWGLRDGRGVGEEEARRGSSCHIENGGGKQNVCKAGRERGELAACLPRRPSASCCCCKPAQQGNARCNGWRLGGREVCRCGSPECGVAAGSPTPLLVASPAPQSWWSSGGCCAPRRGGTANRAGRCKGA